MKKNKILFIFIFLLGAVVLIFIWVKILDNTSRDKNHKKQIGTYLIDIKKTSSGLPNMDLGMYGKLSLVFYDDNRFEFNMEVPFINGTRGTWKSSGSKIDEWNNIYFENWDYSTGITGEQFTQCCDSDSTFYFNSMTPQKGKQPIDKIWFKKLKD